MARYQATVASQSPAAETFGYLAAFSNAAEWDPGVLAGEHLDPGPVRAGSRFRLVVPFAGARMSLTYEVISLVPDREAVLHAANAVLRSVAERAAAGLADALSRRPPGPGSRTAAAAPPRSGGAAQPAGGRP
jgi:hypothetical protein